MDSKNFSWDASAYFERLTRLNRLARDKGFVFARVSSLDGFHDALKNMYSSKGFVAVSDISQGSLSLENSPNTSRVKIVFLALRHAEDDAKARLAAMDCLRELFRQFMSHLSLESTLLAENCVFLNPRISFSEIDRYFFTGCACASFQLATYTGTDLQFNPDEWLPM